MPPISDAHSAPWNPPTASRPTVIRAPWIFPIQTPPIENGELEACSGVITYLGPIRSPASPPDLDLPDTILLPAMLNAHTHLELSGMAGLVPPSTDFADWLFRLVCQYRHAPPTPSSVQAACRAGLLASLEAGVIAVGDISAFPAWTRPVVNGSTLRAVSYGEVIAIGTRRHLLTPRLEAALDAGDFPHVTAGISPHAPYSVEPDALRACADAARRHNVPLCMHLAETRDEEEFTRTGRGQLADHLRQLGVWDDHVPVPSCSPVELVRACGLLSPRTLFAHGNYLDPSEIELLAASGVSIAYCPRTHAAFGHEPHPFRQMLKAGLNVCIGTDSLASNPSLSVLEELRFLHAAAPDVPPALLFEMATTRAAHALGLDERLGTLAEGRLAALLALPLPHPAPRTAATALEHALCNNSPPKLLLP